MMGCLDTINLGENKVSEEITGASDELIEFFDTRFGQKSLVKFVNVGKRRQHSPEYTLKAAYEVYESHLQSPFTSNTIIGQMVHATASRLHRQNRKAEIDAWEFLEKLSKPRTFKQKLKNWMKWGKWE
jgi:hypothetical protein